MIQTVNLTRYFGSLAAVQDLSLTVEQGELFGFLGPNGAGKTTTVRMIIGLLSPTAGTVRVAGHDVQQEPLAVKRADLPPEVDDTIGMREWITPS